MSTALLMGIGGSVGLATPASAAVPGLQRVSLASASNNSSPKTVIVGCPAGKQLVGTGAEITGGQGEVVLDDLRPNGTPPSSVTVTAYEEDPLATNWSVTGYAICANPVAGLVRVSALSSGGSPDSRTVVATCPVGKSLLGTGFEITGGLGGVVLDELRPNGSLTSTTAVACEADPDHLPSWTLTAYGICANTVAVPGLVRVAATSPGGGAPDSASQLSSCPLGKVLVGTGAGLSGATGEVVIDDLRPNAGLNATTATGYEAENPANWTITSYAICANA